MPSSSSSDDDDAGATSKRIFAPHQPDLKGVAHLIKSGKAKRILIMTGAGERVGGAALYVAFENSVC